MQTINVVNTLQEVQTQTGPTKRTREGIEQCLKVSRANLRWAETEGGWATLSRGLQQHTVGTGNLNECLPRRLLSSPWSRSSVAHLTKRYSGLY